MSLGFFEGQKNLLHTIQTRSLEIHTICKDIDHLEGPSVACAPLHIKKSFQGCNNLQDNT
jgi:hypothetical protein